MTNIVTRPRRQRDPVVSVMLTGGRVTSSFRTALFAAASRAGVSVNEFVLTAAAEKLRASGSRFAGLMNQVTSMAPAASDRVRRMGAQQPKSAAQRQREARQRRRDGAAVFRVVVPKHLVQDALVDLGEVQAWSDEDKEELEQALTKIILRTLRDVTA